jgi:hypothetical protein
LKNRDPQHWRDAWQIEASVGKYIISDRPMLPEQWIAERATIVDLSRRSSRTNGRKNISCSSAVDLRRAGRLRRRARSFF